MKSFILSLITFGLVVYIWASFLTYAERNIGDIKEIIEDKAIIYAIDENWESAGDSVERITAKWDQGRMIFSLFFDAVSISSIEGTLARTDAYIKGEEKASVLGELAYLSQQLSFMLENEKLSIENIM